MPEAARLTQRALWEEVLDAALQVDSVDCGWVEWVRPAGEASRVLCARNMPDGLAAWLESQPADGPLRAEEAARHRARSSFPAQLREAAPLSQVSHLSTLPVVSGEEIKAVIQLASFTAEQLSAGQCFLLEALATRASAALTADPGSGSGGASVQDGAVDTPAEAPALAEDRFRKIFEMSPVMMALTDPQTATYVDANHTLVQRLGFTREEVIGTPSRDLGIFVDPSIRDELIRTMVEEGCVLNREIPLRAKDGTVFHVLFSTHWLKLKDRPLMLTTAVDISKRIEAEEEARRLAERLGQTQKMESIGRLAGGVAHDFNNMLTVIRGNTELAVDLASSEAVRDRLRGVLQATQRSEDLTRQLLAFARQQPVSPRVLDVDLAIGGVLKLLRRVISEGIELRYQPASELWHTRMDGGQFDQLLTNLCINAADAVSEDGTISIEVENATLDATACARLRGSAPGDYVLLTVRDDGCGMDTETRRRLFEPFFTTKGLGEGTGLGLATVHGIVQQNHGAIDVQSVPNEGTTFSVYLPRHPGPVEHEPPGTEASARPMRGAGETILLVEDEAAILSVTVSMLTQHGYKVLAAGSAPEALRLIEDRSGPVDLVLSDVIMPRMNGRELASEVLVRYPDARVMFMSGYTASVIEQQGLTEDALCVIQKPFTKTALLEAVRRVLDAAQ